VDVFQAHPDRAIVDPSDARFDRGAQLFFWWLDASYGAQPGSMVRAMWSLSPTRTPLGAARWDDEPDGCDVLKMSFKDALTSGSTIEDLLAEFGASRALLGQRDDGTELVEARPFGDEIVTPSDWVVDWPSKPPRVGRADRPDRLVVRARAPRRRARRRAFAPRGDVGDARRDPLGRREARRRGARDGARHDRRAGARDRGARDGHEPRRRRRAPRRRDERGRSVRPVRPRRRGLGA